MTRPALPPALGLLVGAGAGWSLPAPGFPMALAAAVVTVLAAVVGVARGGRRSAAAVCLLGYALGGLAAGQRARAALPAPLLEWFEAEIAADAPDAVTWIVGRLRRDAVPTDYGAGLTVDVIGVERGRGPLPMRGAVRVGVGGSFIDGRIADWRQGRTVRLPVRLRRPARYANRGTPDQAYRMQVRGIDLLGSVTSALQVEVIEEGSVRQEWGGHARAWVRRAVAATVGAYDARSAAIVTAVLIGDRAGLDRETTERLQQGGIYHVIAISGGNIAVLTAALLLVLRLAGVAGRPASLVSIGCLVAYAQVVAPEASVTRAVFVAIVFLAARAVDHRTDALNTLALAAGCLVAVDPRSLVDPGFQLTFGATAGLLVGVPRLMAWVDDGAADRSAAVRLLLVPPLGLLAATICAELALFPIGAFHFSRVTVAGLGLNFAAIPLMSVTQLAGMAAAGLAPVNAAAAAGAGWIAHVAAAGIVESTRVLAWAPWLSWRLPAPGLGVIAVYYAGWLLCLSAHRGSASRPPGASQAGEIFASRVLGRVSGWVRWGGASLVAGSAAAMLAAPVPGWTGWRTADACALLPATAGGMKPLRVDFLDVDQADATLVRFPDGRSLLVDAAGQVRGQADVGGRVVVPAVWALGVRRLEYLAITHGHPDHIGGAGAVLRDLRPREVWEGIPVPSSEPLAALRAGAGAVGAAWRTLGAGDVRAIGGVQVGVLHPPAPDWERPRVRNDDSLVLELRYGEVSIVLPGDVEAAVEPTIAAAAAPAALRVVKAPHHGSRTSSSAAFVEALSPVLVVVSAGRDHAFGHPHPEVVTRYEAAGAAVLATGDRGAVAVCTDGRGLAASTRDGGRFVRNQPRLRAGVRDSAPDGTDGTPTERNGRQDRDIVRSTQ